MDLEEIKNIIQIDGGKFIIIEEGKPTLVLMSFEAYKEFLQRKGKFSKESQSLFGQQFEGVEKLKKRLTENPELETETLPKISKNTEPPKELKEGLTIEDLPF